MPNYFITGKLGAGKGLVSVGKAFDYLSQGRKVATNVDLFLSGYYAPESKRTYLRLPDKPVLADLETIGFGSDKVEFTEDGSPIFKEEDHGLLLLDELGSWFNARTWQDKERQPVLDFLIHLRKLGWDGMFIIQDVQSCDKQLRGMLCENLVVCRRLDRLKVPYVGGAMRAVGLKGNLPKIHRAKVHYGETEADLVSETWTYSGQQYYRAYNTKQKFTNNYPHGVHSVLSPWHIKGRYLPPKKKFTEEITGAWQAYQYPPNPLPLKPKHPLVDRIAKLPNPQQRLEFLKRFQDCGAFDPPLVQLSRSMRRELVGLV
jgi:hypothetical protein